MKQFKRICVSAILLLSFFIGGNSFCQLAIGQWRDHLSYKKGISITQSDSLIYCATESGVFSLSKSDYSIDRLSKISGLSDVGVNTLRYNDYNQTLLIAYKNANIDLINGSAIYNISDIKRKLITAIKTIHNIHYRNELAYLACGFGIVVLDMNKREIIDTYLIGTNNGYINVRDITSDANFLYAATDSGVYSASLSAPNLADFNYWNKSSGLPAGIYNSIAVLNGMLYTNLSKNLMGGFPPNSDTIYSFNGINWYKPIADASYDNATLEKMEVFNNELVVAFSANVDFFDINGNRTKRIHSGLDPSHSIEPRQAIVETGNSKTTWIADNANGITKNYDIFSGMYYFYPNGPNTSKVYSMSISNEDIWITRGDRGVTWVGTYNVAEAYKFSNENWSSVTGTSGGGTFSVPALDTMRDIVSIAIDPANKEHVYLGTLGAGLVELNNGSFANLWNETNSALQSRGDANYHWVGVFGMAYDDTGNLWITNCYANNPLVVRKKTDSSWLSFNFSGIVTTPTISQIIINQYNQKWMVLPRENGGILVFDENGTWGTGDDKKKRLFTGVGNGNLPSNEITCLAEDHDGEIWVGTNKGIAVFYCPEQVFSSSGCEAQQILIEQDGHTQILLETEVISAIAVDGANRKWIGTYNSGVYLMSEDGTSQVQHFTVDNSPLLSNEIRSIVINPKTGEVYFGTAEGIISYRNDATEGLTDYTDVYVFPNPVQPGYEGPIAITGLMENVDIKITDISGSLVYQTKALGGQAIWYGKNFKGENAHSGVYMVFCSNDDGSKTYIAKILKVN